MVTEARFFTAHERPFTAYVHSSDSEPNRVAHIFAKIYKCKMMFRTACKGKKLKIRHCSQKKVFDENFIKNLIWFVRIKKDVWKSLN